MQITINNCNNVTRAVIDLKEGETTVLFGVNGSGKSTIANAISSFRDPGKNALEGMSPYGTGLDPSIDGVVDRGGTSVFNEQYVEDTLFKGDLELMADGYRVFVETPQYGEAMARTEGFFDIARKRLNDEGDLDELTETIDGLLLCYGKSKEGYSKISPLGKGVGLKGDLVANVPSDFEAFRPFLAGESGKKWISWHKSGALYDNLGVCPYCGKDLNEDGRELCASVQSTYGGKYLDHCFTVFNAFGKADRCLSDKARTQISKILHGTLDDEPTREDLALLATIKTDAEALKGKLEDLKSLGFGALRKAQDKIEFISKLKIDVDSIDKMDSDYTREKVLNINGIVDDLVARATEVLRAVGTQNSELKKALNTSKADIDGFLDAAGFPYELGLVSADGSSCSVFLRSRGLGVGIANPKERLSYGERNALAVALFSAQVNSEKPSLVILDDPISSFDQSKKYAIIQRLFGKRTGVCAGVTTLLFTHDPETLVMLKHIHVHRICPMDFFFVRNDGGSLSTTPIMEEDLGSVIDVLRSAALPPFSLPLRIASARRLIELTDGKTSAWSLLSCLAHRRSELRNGPGDDAAVFTPEEEAEAIVRLEEVGFKGFDYDALFRQLDDDALIGVYLSATSSIEKVCAFRILADKNARMKRARDRAGVGDTVFEFADEFFHVENLMIFQLDPGKYDVVPDSVIVTCDRLIEEYSKEG